MQDLKDNSKLSLESIALKIERGTAIDADDGLYCLTDAPLEPLLDLAHKVTRTHAQRVFDFCSIINAKSGRCTEDCKWCAQSHAYACDIQVYDVVSSDKCLEDARYHEQSGVKRFAQVCSGRRQSLKDLDAICANFHVLKDHTSLYLCASLGLLTKDQLQQLKDNGLRRYHCNLETAPSFFKYLCTTHTQEQKLKTIGYAREVGLDICSGGIIGMGETLAQRVEFALALRDLKVDSIPLNVLHPIKGTPLGDRPVMGEEELLRSVAMFRLTNPESSLRFAGGRALFSLDVIKKCLYAGVNAAITGDLLTTTASTIKKDMELVKEAGYELD